MKAEVAAMRAKLARMAQEREARERATAPELERQLQEIERLNRSIKRPFP